ncbi:prepilin peptidase [Marinactinospora thermotolerans]|uniref:Leader peptidase (Prepilin peptidase) / N-methyltransferase n=1 Tax=Marinactinospora thermotolerans DSM 45154 TaxID=1122192 RepID=A0A1T4KX72_9ACTN|nr:A24 family peptidase [Marinactinospora thermotolerans]SJZ46991.1 leader peptidase (prepilin peptidase) / N-methyltransferase [Marinactinospora thermotolerans DSM 45154]
MPSISVVLPALALALLGGLLGAVAGRVVPLFRAYEPVPDGSQGPPPPQCPHCGTRVPWPRWTPLPARFALTGRCADCATAVRAPAVVGVTAAAVLGGLALLPGRSAVEIPAFAFLGVVGVVLAVVDARTHRLPNPLVLPAYPVALALLGAAALAVPDGGGRMLTALAGMAGVAAFYWVLWFIHPAGMGWGDVKLSGLLGLYLGWCSLGSAVSGTFAAFLFSACYGLVLIALGRATRRSRIPFGPFMIAGAFAVIALGDPQPALLG